MAYFYSYKLPLLAAAALVAPTVAVAQDTGSRIVVIGAMQDTGSRIVVIGATKDRTQTGENPADRAIPALPVVYEDAGATPAPTATAGKAPAAPAPTGR